MQAHETELGFLQKDMRLEIPYFQRPYVWVEKNWEDLYENLIDDKQSHFLGSIILPSSVICFTMPSPYVGLCTKSLLATS